MSRGAGGTDGETTSSEGVCQTRDLGIGQRHPAQPEIPIGQRKEQAEAAARSQQRGEAVKQARLSIQHGASQRSPGQRHTHIVDSAGQDLESIGSSRVTNQEQCVGRTTSSEASGRALR